MADGHFSEQGTVDGQQRTGGESAQPEDLGITQGCEEEFRAFFLPVLVRGAPVQVHIGFRKVRARDRA